MPLVRDDDLVRIDLPENGEWVEVKRRWSRGDDLALNKRWTEGLLLSREMIEKLSEPGVTAEAVGEVALASGMEVGRLLDAVMFAKLDVSIKAWSFDEPVTPEGIRALDGDSVDAITAALDALYPARRTDDDRKNSVGATQEPSSDEAPPRMSLVG